MRLTSWTASRSSIMESNLAAFWSSKSRLLWDRHLVNFSLQYGMSSALAGFPSGAWTSTHLFIHDLIQLEVLQEDVTAQQGCAHRIRDAELGIHLRISADHTNPIGSGLHSSLSIKPYRVRPSFFTIHYCLSRMKT